MKKDQPSLCPLACTIPRSTDICPITPRSHIHESDRLGKKSHMSRAMEAIEKRWASRNLTQKRDVSISMMESLKSIITQSLDLSSSQQSETSTEQSLPSSITQKIQRQPKEQLHTGIKEIAELRKQMKETLRAQIKCPIERLKLIHKRLRKERRELLKYDDKAPSHFSRKPLYEKSPISKKKLLPFDDRQESLKNFVDFLNARNKV